jgi:hypothetical protein
MINTQKGKKASANSSISASSKNERVSQFPVEPPPLKPSEKSSNLKNTNENNSDIKLKHVSDYGEYDLPIDNLDSVDGIS